MVPTMRPAMSERPNKPSESKEKSAVPAIEIARDMLCELSGPRGWHDTRESWLARGARRAGLTLRRARAIFYQEPLRLTADEYLGIERAWQSASQAVASLSHMAGHASLQTGAAAGGGSPVADAPGRRPDEE